MEREKRNESGKSGHKEKGREKVTFREGERTGFVPLSRSLRPLFQLQTFFYMLVTLHFTRGLMMFKERRKKQKLVKKKKEKSKEQKL